MPLSAVSVVVLEALPSILTGVDPDLVRPVSRVAQKAFKEIRLNTKVLKMATAGKQIKVITEIDKEQREELYDRVLVSVGRVPNLADLGLENTKVTKDDKGFIQCNAQQQTEDPNIYAVGDVNGGTLLAHRAFKEAKIAVEAMLGEASAFENVVIPAVVFTDPEVAWCGLTETEAKQKNIEVKIAKFLWGASGRALDSGPARRLDQTDYRTGERAHPRCRHRRRRRRRTDQRRRTRRRDGRHRARHRRLGASASDAFGNLDGSRGIVLRHGDSRACAAPLIIFGAFHPSLRSFQLVAMVLVSCPLVDAIIRVAAGGSHRNESLSRGNLRRWPDDREGRFGRRLSKRVELVSISTYGKKFLRRGGC